MKIKYILSVIAIVAFTQNSFAQYSQDAIRFSQTTTGSTSRIKAVGNAGTAVGGDLSNISGNPAGLGFFTRSEFSITPEYDASRSKSTYFGQAGTASRNSGNLNHAGLVIYNQLTKPAGADKNKGWLSVNYGVAFSRVSDFNQNIRYKGSNSTNSINSYFASQANDFGIDEGSLAGWAYDQQLIDTYTSGYGANNVGPTTQEAIINRTGGQSGIDFSIGGNYSNKLYLGLGLSFTDINYNSYGTFYEDGTLSVLEGPAPGTPTDRNFSSAYSQNQITKGTGFSARLGVIYKPTEAVRLGAVFTSPTFYNIDDIYYEGLSSKVGSNAQNDNESDDYRLNYNLRTPLKIAGGAAVFIKHFGFITGDVEYVDYSSAHLGSNPDYDADYRDNGEIKSLYKSAINAHIGAEARLTSFFLLRGGYGIQGDARKENGSDIKTTSGGIGLRFGSYYIDATYAHSTGRQNIFPYDIGSTSPSAALRNSNNNGYLTLGYRF
ncbi:hypothetical protein EWM62_00555 [Mucilaginibacter terrigena]|uniref:Aromatic hydrocarbon degradation protein n=1 Tax=Mucilaginibacter terrigena TaxID=2492395 RepID=A0A4Q5LR36_9SPHI|nr:hypothetical protein [Mucilaginibacter terrigena]RYU91966.1 hypothetical protein EWM62_00555 [Mucilaginibacter terrigena]